MLIVLLIVAFGGIIFEVIPMGTIIQKGLLFFLLLASLVFRGEIKISRLPFKILFPYLLYLFYSALSAWAASRFDYITFTALVALSIGPLFFLYVSGEAINRYSLKKMRAIALTICIIQITFSIYKLLTHGIDEKNMIGTMSNSAGQLGFLFPALGIPILIFLMKNKSRIIMWLLLVGMFGFGIINEKRSCIFLLPLIGLLSIKANENIKTQSKRLEYFIKYAGITIFFCAMALLGLSSIPSLNPESKYGGSIDITYALNYITEYLTMNYGDSLQGSYENAVTDKGIQVGRWTLFSSIIQWLLKSDLSVKLFGVGTGNATASLWRENDTDALFTTIGTRGAISGFGLTLIETGIIGALIMIYFFYNLRKMIHDSARISKDLFYTRWLKTVNILVYVFIYDYFFYSTILLRTLPVPILFFSAIATLNIKKAHGNKPSLVPERNDA